MEKIDLFLGTERGFEVLKKLIELKLNVNQVLILVQKPHEISNFTNEIIKLCKSNKIKYKTTKEVTPSKYLSYLKKSKPDILFVISWRYLIPKICFNIPRFGIFILHDSLLPKYRGFSPTNWVIINGEKETGLTLQYANEHMDSGDIVDQIKIHVTKNETATTLNNKFLKIYPDIILKNYKKIITGKNNKNPQNEKDASYAVRRNPNDGKINFNEDSKKIIRLINGLSYPYPGAFCIYKNKKIIIWEANLAEKQLKFIGNIPGKIVSFEDEFVNVLTLNKIITIKKISLYEKPNEFLKPAKLIKHIGDKLL